MAEKRPTDSPVMEPGKVEDMHVENMVATDKRSHDEAAITTDQDVGKVALRAK